MPHSLPPRESATNIELRRQLFVAPKAQGHLLMRVALYCVITAIGTAGMCFAATSNQSTAALSAWIGAPVLTILLVTPLVLYDAAKASNRMIGPFARLQRAVRQLANGDETTSFRPRRREPIWEDWIVDFNLLVEKLQPRNRAANTAQAAEGDGACCP